MRSRNTHQVLEFDLIPIWDDLDLDIFKFRNLKASRLLSMHKKDLVTPRQVFGALKGDADNISRIRGSGSCI